MTDDATAPDPQSESAPARHWREEPPLLRQRDLGRVLVSRFVSDLGTGMAPIALAVGVLSLAGGDARSLGLVLLCAAVSRMVAWQRRSGSRARSGSVPSWVRWARWAHPARRSATCAPGVERRARAACV